MDTPIFNQQSEYNNRYIHHAIWIQVFSQNFKLYRNNRGQPLQQLTQYILPENTQTQKKQQNTQHSLSEPQTKFWGRKPTFRKIKTTFFINWRRNKAQIFCDSKPEFCLERIKPNRSFQQQTTSKHYKCSANLSIIISMIQSAHRPAISNINFYAKLSSTVDLEKLAINWFENQGISYSPVPIPKIFIQYEKGVVANVSPQGAIVILGKIHPKEAQGIMISLKKRFSNYLGKKFSFQIEPKVTSIMASSKLPFKVHLESLQQKIVKCGRADKHPAVWWKIQKYGVDTIAIFSSGSMLICGAKSLEALDQVYDKMEEILYQFRKFN